MTSGTKILGTGLVSMMFAMGCGSSSTPTGSDAGTGSDVVATGDTGGGGGDGGTGGALCTPNATGAATTFDYVITTIAVDGNQTPSATARPVFGFDLDNTRSPVTRPAEGAPHCAHGDFTSMLDQDQNADAMGRPCAAGSAGCSGGVDNQLPAVVDALGQFMAGLDVGNLLREQINSGSLVLLARVSDVNGELGPTLCDDNVTIRLYLGYPMFSNCANIQMPNQMYAIAASSVMNPMDPSSALIQFPGSIVNGRLRVRPSAGMASRPSFSIPLPISGVDGLSLDLYNTQLRVTMNADGTGSNGNLGGVILKRDLLTALGRVPQLMPFLAAAAPLLDGFVDVATPLGGTGSLCTGMGASGMEEGGIGLGLGFTTVRANIANMVLSDRMTGTCGAGTGGGGDAGTGTSDAGTGTGDGG
ncbi:MAG: hypothetical protein R3A48_18505 [Polyangiales bacterium]